MQTIIPCTRKVHLLHASATNVTDCGPVLAWKVQRGEVTPILFAPPEAEWGLYAYEVEDGAVFSASDCAFRWDDRKEFQKSVCGFSDANRGHSSARRKR